MATPPSPDNYTVHKGKVLYKPKGKSFYVDVGNAPSVTYTPNVQTLDHYSSRAGLREKDKTVTTEVSATFSVTADEIVAENIARVALGDTVENDQASGSGGAIDASSAGAGDVIDTGYTHIQNVVMDSGSGAEGTDYEVDRANGIIRILSSGGAGTYSFDYQENKNRIARLLTQTEIEGGFIVAGQSAVGRQMKIIVPRVSLSAQNDLSLIQDQDWMSLTFQGEVLKDETVPDAPFGRVIFL